MEAGKQGNVTGQRTRSDTDGDREAGGLKLFSPSQGTGPSPRWLSDDSGHGT